MEGRLLLSPATISSILSIEKDNNIYCLYHFAGQLWRISYLYLATSLIDLAALPINQIFMTVGILKHVFASSRSQHDLPQTDFDKFDASSQPAVSKEDSDESADHNLLEGINPYGLASIHIALAILRRKTEFYRSQLGLPEKDSDEFKMLKPVFQKRMKMFYQKEDEGFWRKCFAIPTNSSHTIGQLDPFKSATNSLNYLLDEMQKLSLDLLDDATSMKEEKEHVPSETE